jgi:hypothetical protein
MVFKIYNELLHNVINTTKTQELSVLEIEYYKQLFRVKLQSYIC